MNSLAKLTITLFVILCSMVMSGKASAYHGSEPAGLPPLPVKQCYHQAQVYQRYIVGRLAGLTIEETLLANSFTVRVSKYMIEANGFDPATADEEAALIDEMTYAVYEIPENNLESQAWIQEYVTAEFDKCIAEIPELAEPDDGNAFDRMLE